MSLYDRVLRAMTALRVFREITSTLGLERELIVHGFGEGDSTVFAPNDKAWLLTLAELMMTGEEAMNHATAVLAYNYAHGLLKTNSDERRGKRVLRSVAVERRSPRRRADKRTFDVYNGAVIIAHRITYQLIN